MLSLLMDSALRSLFLGLTVWALLKLVRLSDTRTETAIWTAVLLASVSMPLLSRFTPTTLLIVPHLLAVPSGSAAAPRRALGWFARGGDAYLLGLYALGFLVCATRIAVGLMLTWRLYRRAVPVNLAWAQGRNIRISVELKSPVSIANTIVLPADHAGWSAEKRAAVLAHEEAHIARADFFVQLAALIHCAFFWFSPFAWWLRSKLAIIAETASDEAAILRLNDRAAYAEILIEVAHGKRRAPLIVGMANGPFIQQRIEHILSEARRHNLSLPFRVLTLVTLAALAFGVAGARAVLHPASPMSRATVAANAAPTTTTRPTVTRKKPEASSTPRPVARSGRLIPETLNEVSDPDDDITYNPRALLDAAYVSKPDVTPPSTIVHGGKTFYIRSTESPVADGGVP